MKTDEFINVLVADTQPPHRLQRFRIWLPLASLTALAAILFWFLIGVRADIYQAALTWRFNAKFVMVAGMAIAMIQDFRRLLDPTKQGWRLNRTAAVAASILVCAVMIELVTTTPVTWRQRLVGSNAVFCLGIVPLLSILPLVGALWSMRQGAPREPALAGALCGALAAAIGALLYATHCSDDSPLFVAVWYWLAAGPVVLAGFFIGRRHLSW